VPALVASVLEPAVAALGLLAAHSVFHQPFGGPSKALLVLLLVLMFPGVDRFGRSGIGLIIDIGLSWAGTLIVLLLLGYATDALQEFDRTMLTAWGIGVPLVQWALVWTGSALVQHHATLPSNQRTAVVVGANRMGVRVARMLQTRHGRGRELLGFFDDRAKDGLELPDDMTLVGKLESLPAFIDAHSVKDVYITLSLSSQPRILKLLEALENSTAELHYVPDVFGVSIIQGRLADIDGVPVVSLRVTPFTGVNGLLKRISDLVLASLILMLISPVLLVVAIGVKRSSPGPVLFKQRRTGLDGEVIEVYKFRSMTVQDNGDDVKQAIRGMRASPLRRLHPAHLSGRTAPVHQCVAGADEHRRAPAACRGAQRAIPQDRACLHGTAQGQARHHGLGAGQRPARRNRYRREDGAPGRI
jgi:putative colanic acid biosynthesis UDP-glucose lipid carrier transferase